MLTDDGVSLDRLTGGPILVLAPHPDDETLGCGMAIAAARRRGIEVRVVVLTDGGASHPNSRTYPKAKLVALRRRELLAAGSELGLPNEAISSLDWPDGRLTPDRVDGIARNVHEIIGQWTPSVVWTTWQGDPHCDHEVAALVGQRLARMYGCPIWQYSVWGRLEPSFVITSGTELALFFDTKANADKRRAASHYKSQLTSLIDDDPAGFVMEEDHVDRLISEPEMFIAGREG